MTAVFLPQQGSTTIEPATTADSNPEHLAAAPDKVANHHKPAIYIKVQTQDFSQQVLYQQLAATPYCGAVVTFTGLVRDHPELQLQALELEHYPGMTEKALQQIATEASQRFELKAISIIHRVGLLTDREQIVFVGVASAHRSSAFAGAEFIMDYLKTRAPIWKKQHDSQGSAWVEAKASDTVQQQRWQP